MRSVPAHFDEPILATHIELKGSWPCPIGISRQQPAARFNAYAVWFYSNDTSEDERDVILIDDVKPATVFASVNGKVSLSPNHSIFCEVSKDKQAVHISASAGFNALLPLGSLWPSDVVHAETNTARQHCFSVPTANDPRGWICWTFPTDNSIPAIVAYTLSVPASFVESDDGQLRRHHPRSWITGLQ